MYVTFFSEMYMLQQGHFVNFSEQSTQMHKWRQGNNITSLSFPLQTIHSSSFLGWKLLGWSLFASFLLFTCSASLVWKAVLDLCASGNWLLLSIHLDTTKPSAAPITPAALENRTKIYIVELIVKNPIYGMKSVYFYHIATDTDEILNS